MAGLTREQRAAKAAVAAKAAAQYSHIDFDDFESIMPDVSDAYGKIVDDPEWAYLWMRIELEGKDDAKNIASQTSGKLAYEYVDAAWMAERHGPHWLVMGHKRANDAHVIRVSDVILMRIPRGLRQAYINWSEAKTRKYSMATNQAALEKMRASVQGERYSEYVRPFTQDNETLGDYDADGPRGRRPVIDE